MAFPEGLTPAQLLFPDLDEEFASTRRMLAIVPEGKNAFRPDDKSRTLGELAGHIAELPAFGASVLATNEFDFAKVPWHTQQFVETSGLLEEFDRNAATFQSGIDAATWGALDERWTLRAGEHVIVEEQKAKLLRSITLSHISHHRLTSRRRRPPALNFP